MEKQFDVLDIISILSFYIAIQNWQENEMQSDLLAKKLDNQDEKYLKKTINLLEESIRQNDIIIKQNEKLLERR